MRQAKLAQSSWLRSQPDKVSRPSEPSLALVMVTSWVKRRQGGSRPQSASVKVSSPKNAYVVEQGDVVRNTEYSNEAIVIGEKEVLS